MTMPMQSNFYSFAMHRSATFISRLKLRRCAEVGFSPSVVGRIWVLGEGTLRIGNRVRLDASSAPIEFYIGPGAEITLGDDVEIEGGTSITALQSIQIGDGCRVGAKCKILDNNFHQVGKLLERPQSVPVVIEAGVTLGNGAIVLPGARIRGGSDINRGSVISGRSAAVATTTGQEEAAATTPLTVSRSHLVRCFLNNLQKNPTMALSITVAFVRGKIVLRSCQQKGRVFAFGSVRIRNHGIIQLGDRVSLGSVRVRNHGIIQLGDRVGFRRGMICSELICHPGAELRIGDGTGFNYAASIEAYESVTIGARCMIASMVRLADRSEGASGPLTIGDDVWIAHGAVIRPSVSIGSGSVISAGAVVTKDVPPRSLAIGNPARCISLTLFAAGRRT